MSRVLVTGGSSGIGKDVATEFARHGHDVVLVARSDEKLRSIADELSVDHNVQAEALVHDLSEVEQIDGLVDQLRKQKLPIDTLVNNAGFGALGDFAELDVDRQTDMVMVNVTALT